MRRLKTHTAQLVVGLTDTRHSWSVGQTCLCNSCHPGWCVI